MGNEPPSTHEPLHIPPSAWGVIKDALISGQIGAIIGTVALIIIAGQYLGLMESPMITSQKGLHDMSARSIALILSNQSDIRRMDEGINDLTTALWAVCFTQATTTEAKVICKDGMLKQQH